jgi:hypothetical protein
MLTERSVADDQSPVQLLGQIFELDAALIDTYCFPPVTGGFAAIT